VSRSSTIRRRWHRRGQSGSSLIEVLIGVLVMMPLTLAAAMGLMTATTASASARTNQELQIALSTATENVKAMPYVECAGTDDYQQLYADWVQPLAARVIDGTQTANPVIERVDHYDRNKGTYDQKCSKDDAAQRVTVTVNAEGRSATGTVVKRDDAASAQGNG